MSDLGPNSLCDEQKLYNFIYDDVDDSDIFASEPLNTSSAESDLKSETEQFNLHPPIQSAKNSEETEALRQQIEKLHFEKVSLEKQISELYKTARAEIDRKDRRLKDLEKERDDILFKRGQHKFGTSHVKVESRVPVLQQVDNEEVINSNLRYRIPKKKRPSVSDHETCEPNSENDDLLEKMDENSRKREKNVEDEHKDNKHWSAYPYLKETTSRYEDKYLGGRLRSNEPRSIQSRNKSSSRYRARSPSMEKEAQIDKKDLNPSREREHIDFSRERTESDDKNKINTNRNRSRSKSRPRSIQNRSKSSSRYRARSLSIEKEGQIDKKDSNPSREREHIDFSRKRDESDDKNRININRNQSRSKSRPRYIQNRSKSSSRYRARSPSMEKEGQIDKKASHSSREREHIPFSRERNQNDDKNDMNRNRGRSKSRHRYTHRSPELYRGKPRTPSRERDEVADKPRLICEDRNIKSNDDNSSLRRRTKSTSDGYMHVRKNRSKSRDHESDHSQRGTNKQENKNENKKSVSDISNKKEANNRSSSRDRHTKDAREVIRDLKERQLRRSRSLSQERDTRQTFKRDPCGRFSRKSPEKRKFGNKDNHGNNKDRRRQNYFRRNRNISTSEEREGSRNVQIEDNTTIRRDRFENIMNFRYKDNSNRPRQIQRSSRLQNWERSSRPTNVHRLRERLMRHSLEKESAAFKNVLRENKSRCMDNGRIDNETDHSDLDDLKLHLSGESDIDSLKQYGNTKDKRDEATHSEDDEDLDLLKGLGLDAENMTDEQLEKLLEERKQELYNKSVLNSNEIKPDKFKGVQHVSDYKYNMNNKLGDTNYNIPTHTRKIYDAWDPFNADDNLDYEMSPIELNKEETHFGFDTKCKETNVFHKNHMKQDNMADTQVNQINKRKASLISHDDMNKPTFRTVFEARQHKKMTTQVESNVQNDEPPKVNIINTQTEQKDTVRDSLKLMLRERKKSSSLNENRDEAKTEEVNLDKKKLIKMNNNILEEKIQKLKVDCGTTSVQMKKLKHDVTDKISKTRLSSESEEKTKDERQPKKLNVEEEKQAVIASKQKEKITFSVYKNRSWENGSKKRDKLESCVPNVFEKSQLETNTFTNHNKSASPNERIENHTKTIPLKTETKKPKNSKDEHSSTTLPNNVLISEKESQSIHSNANETSSFSNKKILEEQPVATNENPTVKDFASDLLNQNKSFNERDDESKDVSSFIHDLSISDDEDEVPFQVISVCNQEEQGENNSDKKIKVLSNIAIQNSNVNFSNVPTSDEPIEKLPVITKSILNKSVEKVECIEEIQQAVSNIMILNNSKPKSPLNKNKLNTEELQKCLEEDLEQTQTKNSSTQDTNIEKPVEKIDKTKKKLDRIEVVTNKRNANIVFISSPLKRDLKSKRHIRMTLLPEDKSPDLDKRMAEINNEDTMQRLFGYMTPSPCKFSEVIPSELNKEKVKRKIIDENDDDLGGNTFKMRDKNTKDGRENINKCVSQEDQSQINSKVKNIRQRSKSVDESKVIEMMQMEKISKLQNGGKEIGEKINNWQNFSNNPTYIPNLKEKKIIAFDSPNHYIQKKNQEIIKMRRQSLDAKLLDINIGKNNIEEETDLGINLKTKLEDENGDARKTLNILEKDTEKTKQLKPNKARVTNKDNLANQNTEIKHKKKGPDEQVRKKVNSYCNLKLNKPKNRTKKSPLKKNKSPGFKIKLVQQKRQKNNAKEILPNKKRKVNVLESSESEPELDEIKDFNVKKLKKAKSKTQNKTETIFKDDNTSTDLSNSHKEQMMESLPNEIRKANVLVSESELDEIKNKKDLNVKKLKKVKSKTQNKTETIFKDDNTSTGLSNSHKEQMMESLPNEIRKANVLVSESELDEIKNKKDLNVKNLKKTKSKTLKVEQNEKDTIFKDENTSTGLSNSHSEQIMESLPNEKRKANVLVSASSKCESELGEIKDKKDLNVRKVKKTESKIQKTKQKEKETINKDENTSTELSNSHKEQIMDTLLKESKKIGVTRKEIKNLNDNQGPTEKGKKKETKGEKNKRNKKTQKESVCINTEKDVGHDILDKKLIPVITKDMCNLEQPVSNDSTKDESFKTIKRITPKRIGDSSFKMKNEVMFKDLKAKRELFSENSCTEPGTTNKRKHPSDSIEDIRPEKAHKLICIESTRTVEDHVMDNASHSHIKVHETHLDIEVAPNSSPLPRIEQTYEAITKANSSSRGTGLNNKSPFIDVKNPLVQPSHEGVFPDIQLHASNSTFNEINLDTKDIDMLGEVERAIYFNLHDMSISDKSLLTLGREKKSGKDSGDSIIGGERDGTNVKDKDHLNFSNFLNKNENTSTPIRNRRIDHRPNISSERAEKHEKEEEGNINKDSVIKSSNKPVPSSENIVATTVSTTTVTNISYKYNVSISKTSAMSVGDHTSGSSVSRNYNKFGRPLKRNKITRISMKIID